MCACQAAIATCYGDAGAICRRTAAVYVILTVSTALGEMDVTMLLSMLALLGPVIFRLVTRDRMAVEDQNQITSETNRSRDI